MRKKLPKLNSELVGPIENYKKAIEKANTKGFKKPVIPQTIKKLKLKNLVPKPRPIDGFAVNKDVMLDRGKNQDGNLDVRLKVSYERSPNSIGQVLVPIELYDLVNEHPNQKTALALLLNAVQKGLLKSCSDGNIYKIDCRDGSLSLKTKQDSTPVRSAKKKTTVKKKSVTKTNPKPTNIPADKILKKIYDPDLGNFKYDDDEYLYRSNSVSWCGQKVRFNLSVEESEDTRQRFMAAKRVWKDQKRWQKNCMDYVATEMLEVANKWLESQSCKAISSTTLKKRIKLTSLEFFEEGDVTFWYDTENLFCEKGICVFANVSGEIFESTND